MKKVFAFAVLFLAVTFVAAGQSIVPDGVVQVGENVFSNALGWQEHQRSSTFAYVPFGGALFSLGTFNLIQFITAPTAAKPVPKLLIGITCILAAGAAVGYSINTSNTW